MTATKGDTMDLDDIDKHLAIVREAGASMSLVWQALQHAADVRRELAAMKTELDREKRQRDDLEARVRQLWAHANATPVTSVHKRMHEEQELRRKTERDNQALREDLAAARRELVKANGGKNHCHITEVMAAAEKAGVSRPARQRMWTTLLAGVSM